MARIVIWLTIGVVWLIGGSYSDGWPQVVLLCSGVAGIGYGVYLLCDRAKEEGSEPTTLRGG